MMTTSDHDPGVFTTSTSSPANHNQPDKRLTDELGYITGSLGSSG